MERAGTGLSDAEELARELGGHAAFTHDKRTNRFVARMYQPAASHGSKTIARENRPIGVYILNALLFSSLPERVSILRLKVPIFKRPPELSLDDAGTFVWRDDVLWSFVPPNILEDVLFPIIDVSASKAVKREDLERTDEGRNAVSWLIRKHFEQHLARLEHHGLILDSSRRNVRRAYFQGRDGKPRTLTYDTAKRQRINRQVVKQRAEGEKVWFENEGFGYEVVQMDGRWAIRIKPFYMFTRRDARTPLPSFARTARATRRIKFDRNKNVEDDLTFWGRFLRQDSPTINIGHRHVDDFILDGSFLDVEVVEEGLEEDSDENQNRSSA